jgi:hypothetical protein
MMPFVLPDLMSSHVSHKMTDTYDNKNPTVGGHCVDTYNLQSDVQLALKIC